MRTSTLLFALLLLSTSVPIQGKSTVPLFRLPPNSKADLPCSVCVDFFDSTLNDFLNIILNVGVGAGCVDLCEQLSTQLEQGICLLMCTVVGFEVFVDVLSNVDLDPIYMCTAIDFCPTNNCMGPYCINITSVAVSPVKAPLRTTFNVDVFLKVLSQTGTGVTRLIVIPPTGDPNSFGMETLNTGFAPGSYKVSFGVETDWEDWTFPPGMYRLLAESCASDCDNDHGFVFSTYFGGNFTITPS